MRKSLATGGAGTAGRERPGSPARRPVLISTARPLASRQLARDRPVTSRLTATGEQSGGDARGAGTDAMPGSPLSAAMAWAPRFIWGRPGPGRTPVVRVHRGAPGRMRWPEAGRESRSRTPGSRAMHSSNRAWLVRTLQLVILKNKHDF